VRIAGTGHDVELVREQTLTRRVSAPLCITSPAAVFSKVMAADCGNAPAAGKRTSATDARVRKIPGVMGDPA
jgi:hypothetical protein